MSSGRHTQGSVLKRECHNVLDTFDGGCERIPWETFTDNDLDSTRRITCRPLALEERFLPEAWEFEKLWFAGFRHV